MTARPRLLLFDLYAGGHHLQHFEQHAAFWTQHDLPGELLFGVPRTFLEQHPVLETIASQHPRIHILPIEEAPRLKPSDTSLRRLIHDDREHGRLLRALVEAHRPDQVLLMIFDRVQYSLAFDLRFRFPVTISGIYFRPSFHYPELGTTAISWKERLRNIPKRRLLQAAIHNPHFRYLFSLDPYAVPFIPTTRSGAMAVALPDGIQHHPSMLSRQDMRRQWQVNATDVVALFFGVIDERKGIFRLLEALSYLPRLCQQRLVLVISGKTPQEELPAVTQAIEQAKARTEVRILQVDRFVPDEEIQPMFRGADIALVPYQRHIGSSGVLIRAATEATPVLASDYGVVGEHVRRHHLGLAVDTTVPTTIAATLEKLIGNPEASPFDPLKARQFASENTAEAYGRVIYETLGLMPR